MVVRQMSEKKCEKFEVETQYLKEVNARSETA